MALSKLKPNSFHDTVEGNPSLVINGDMAIWQRGTTIDTIASGNYLCDRWRVSHGGTDGNVDVDRSTDVPSGQGFAYSQKISMDASEASLDADDNVLLAQRFEGQNLQHLRKGTSSAKSITLSFWVKSSVAETYTVNIYDADNSRQISKTYVINAADTWEKKTITFAGDTSGALDNDNARSIDVGFWLDAGSNWYDGTLATSWESYTKNNRVEGTTGWLESTSPEFYITGVKLEVGSVATPYRHESYEENLNKCFRYHVRYGAQTTSSGLMNMNVRTTSSAKYGVMHFPTKMRAVPSMTISSASHFTVFFAGSSATPTAASYQGGTLLTAEIYWTASGGSVGDGGWIRIVNTSGYLDFDAEL
jgi:hypothetical protein